MWNKTKREHNNTEQYFQKASCLKDGKKWEVDTKLKMHRDRLSWVSSAHSRNSTLQATLVGMRSSLEDVIILMPTLTILSKLQDFWTKNSLQLQSSRDCMRSETTVKETQKDTQLTVISTMTIPTPKPNPEPFN